MIRELAEFEEAADECTVTETQMHAALFGPNPTAYAHMVEVDGAAAATAVWFRKLPRGTAWRGSTWRTSMSARRSGAAVWPESCCPRWPPNASSTATPG